MRPAATSTLRLTLRTSTTRDATELEQRIYHLTHGSGRSWSIGDIAAACQASIGDTAEAIVALAEAGLLQVGRGEVP